MLLDKEAQLATTVAFDLEAVRPGPGMPVKLYATGMTPAAVVTVTNCATVGGTYTACTTAVVDTDGSVEFELPSSTRQFIKSTFAAGDISVILPGAQTNI